MLDFLTHFEIAIVKLSEAQKSKIIFILQLYYLASNYKIIDPQLLLANNIDVANVIDSHA